MPKSIELNGVLVEQSPKAVVASVLGDFLGLIVSPCNGGTISLFRYENETYAVLSGSITEPLITVLEHLQNGDLFTEILACELPNPNLFEGNASLLREHHVRADLLE